MIIESWNDKEPTLDPTAFVATGAAVVGDVRLGPDSSVWYGCVLRGDDHWIRVGAGSNIQDGTVIHVSLDAHPTRIVTSFAGMLSITSSWRVPTANALSRPDIPNPFTSAAACPAVGCPRRRRRSGSSPPSRWA